MKKIINAAIAQTAFTFEEDAYTSLSTYLSDIRTHFQADSSAEEIIEDIEARIAELLLASNQKIIGSKEVNSVIEAMGSVTAFDDDITKEETATSTPHTARILYRDSERKIIGGVSSGIAAFFDIDPVIIRALFIVSIFFGGAGIFIYILLWIIVPEAKTPSQKLTMQGNPITVDSLRDFAKQTADRTVVGARAVPRLVEAPLNFIGAVIGSIFPFLRKALGVLLVISTFFAALAATISLVILATNYQTPFINQDVIAAIPFALLTAFAISAYLAFVIPCIFLLLAGVQLYKKQYHFRAGSGFTLIGLWTLAVIVFFATTTQLVMRYQEFIDNNPAHVERTENREVAAFSSIKSNVDYTTIILTSGEPSIKIQGQSKDLEDLVTVVEDGVLLLKRNTDSNPCVALCPGRGRVEVFISTPTTSAISMEYGNLTLDNFSAPVLSISKMYGAVDGTLNTKSLTLSLKDSDVTLTGSSTHADITLSTYSSFVSPEFFITHATTSSSYPSEMDINVTETLYVKDARERGKGSGIFTVIGNPTINYANNPPVSD